MSVVEKLFGQTRDGLDVFSYSLYQADGSFCTILSYGCILQRLLVPDRTGMMQDVVMGYDTLAEYEQRDNPYHGALVGRFANRIENASFEIDNKRIQLSANNGIHHIHGGFKGFSRIVWQADAFESAEGSSVRFYYLSPDGEEGYPGNLDVQATYTWTADHRLILAYEAVSDQKTVVNLTNHSYFNLNGQGSGSIFNHLIKLDADGYTPIDDQCIPTGSIVSVDGTAFDFREFKRIGEAIEAKDPMIASVGGYDHNFVVRGPSNALRACASVFEPKSGRSMQVMTTKPGVQFYTANSFKPCRGKEGVQYERQNGFCLETQHFPNSPRMAQFPSPFVEPGETYRHITVYKFGVASGPVAVL
ncbi:MAG: galactose mutarotase [Clostridiaceae bacterium]|jgi:aldose 1-epimerase|nr:galactose mutarotase [Clostridiaceae bacterium]